MNSSQIATIFKTTLKMNGLSGLKTLFYAYLNLKSEPLKLSTLPIMAQIEPTLYCNFKCQICINPVTDREKRHLKLGEFKDILNGIPSLRKISLVGAGEPLLNPDIFEMILYAKSSRIITGLATNGALLSDHVCAKIKNTGVDWINISIDSANKDKFEAIRKGADFQQILDNIKRLVETKGDSSSPDISLWFVVMKDNFNELPGVIRLAKELGIKNVSAQLQHTWGKPLFESLVSKSGGQIPCLELKNTLRQAKSIADHEKVLFDYVNIPDSSLNRYCKWPWRACYITADGFVTPCCMHGSDPRIINFGNIFKEKFDSIWNNALYQNFRQQLKSKNIPSICVGCPSYYDKIKV